MGIIYVVPCFYLISNIALYSRLLKFICNEGRAATLLLIFFMSSTFLFRHFLICLYGAVALGFVLAGRAKELKVVYILTGKLMLIPSWRLVAFGPKCNISFPCCSLLWCRKFFPWFSSTCCTGASLLAYLELFWWNPL